MELIDTDVLIDVQRGFGAAADWFATGPDVGVPGFVVMELVQDARNSDEVQKARRRETPETRETGLTPICTGVYFVPAVGKPVTLSTCP